MSRTENTSQKYLARAEQLIFRAKLELDINQPSLTEIVKWLVTKRKHWSKSTWRQYRAAMRVYIKNQDCYVTSANVRFDSTIAAERLDLADSVETLQLDLQTSGRKMKKLPTADLDRLISYFQDATHIRHGHATLIWLLSGLWTGLRPVEWKHARLESAVNNPLLVVENAKATNGRSHGILRTIHLTGMAADEYAILKLHLEFVATARSTPEGFESHYRSCRDCLYEANKKIWPRRQRTISLYTVRHQFVADAKACGLSQLAIAALMGHASSETAATHYGRRVSGRRGLRVTADASDLERVEHLNSHRHEGHQAQCQELQL